MRRSNASVVHAGYKVVRIPLENGAPVADAGYEDFMTGFALDERQAWGRPVGLAAAADGALLITTMAAAHCVA